MTASAPLTPELTSAVTTAIVAFAALIVVAGSLGSLRAGRRSGMLLATYLGIGLEFFLAAGLIRLASAETFEAIGLAAAIIALRQMVSFGLRYAARATG